MEPSTLYKRLAAGKITAAEVRQLYVDGKVGQHYLSAYLEYTHSDTHRRTGPNIQAAHNGDSNAILHAANISCCSPGFKDREVFCVQSDSIIQHKVGECHREAIQ